MFQQTPVEVLCNRTTWVKKIEPVYFSVGFPGLPTFIDHRSKEYSVEEQRILKSYDFTNLGRFRFLVRFANREGDLMGNLSLISIENFDKNQYPNNETLTKARTLLMQRYGSKMNSLIQDIDLRMPKYYMDLSTSKKERVYLWST